MTSQGGTDAGLLLFILGGLASGERVAVLLRCGCSYYYIYIHGTVLIWLG